MVKSAARAAAQDSANDAALAAFLKQMEKDKPGEVRRMDDEAVNVHIDVIPSGALSLDRALGIGGFPRGRMVELYGEESSGKTSLALAVAAKAQQQGLNVGFVDAEHSLTRSHAAAYGVDFHRLVMYQPTSGEDGLEMLKSMCRSGAFAMVIVDSVAALVPQAELDGEIGDQRVGVHARMMSQAMRQLTGVAHETNTLVVWINQLRMTPTQYGDPRVTTGGKALKFYASVRIEVSSPKSKKIAGPGGAPIGQTCTAKVVKNKVGPPMRQAEYDIFFDSGLSAEGSLIDTARELGVITVRGASHVRTSTGEMIAIGREKVKTALSENPELAEALTAECYAAMRDPGAAQAPEVDTATLDDADPEGGSYDESADQVPEVTSNAA